MIELTLIIWLLGDVVGVWILPEKFENLDACTKQAQVLIEHGIPGQSFVFEIDCAQRGTREA